MKNMPKCLLAAVLSASAVLAATGGDPSPDQISSIITKFAAKEAEFAQARANYTYRQSVKVQELDAAGTPGGKHEIISDIIFTPEGKRTERVVRAPMDTLREISISPEDEQDLRSVQPFVLTTAEIDKYNVRYLGRETLDEISCYVFAVRPKTMEKGQRYFSGIVWVDDRDLQIVKTYGRAVGVLRRGNDQAFPKFETYREQIDGKYWFPTYTIANDTLNFQSGQQVRIKMTVKYEDYKKFESGSTIKYGDEVKSTPESAKPPVKK